MPLGLEVGLGHGHVVLDGDSQRGIAHQFSVHVCYGITAGWIKIPIGSQRDLGPGDIVLDGDPAPPSGGRSPQVSPRACCGQMVWMDQDATR